MRGDELEMLDHRMAGKSELAGDLNALVAGGDAGKGDATFHHMLFDAVEAPEKVEMPPRAAEFAVGDRLQANFFLFLDDALDLTVLDRLEVGRTDFALSALLARLLERGRTQQATDMISAKRRFCSHAHRHYPHTS